MNMMQLITDKLQKLLNDVEHKIDGLFIKIDIQKKEITSLQLKNIELKETYIKTLNKIEEYVRQLEQIKNEHINNKYNIKQ